MLDFGDQVCVRFDVHVYIFAGLLSILPISELRGAIPYALANKVAIPVAFIMCTLLNMLVAPAVFLFLSTLHRLFCRMGWYDRAVNRLLARARTKVKAKVDRYGYYGVMLFVAIPLPITGAYTGTLGAWVLGLDRKKTILAVSAGVLIAGIVVTIVASLGIEALSIFIKPEG